MVLEQGRGIVGLALVKTAVDVAGMTKEEVAECFVHLMPYSRFNVFLTGGGGFMNYEAEDTSGSEFARRKDYAGWEPVLSAGVGCEYFLHPRFGVTFTLDNRFPLTDELDGSDHGGMDDNYWNAKAGFTVYLPR